MEQNQLQTQAPENQQVVKPERDIADSVLARIKNLQECDGLVIPKNYNPGNALKSALLKLRTVKDRNKKPAMEVCTRDSAVNALFDMCIQGLTPAKNQCYFIVRGDQLTLCRSYFGTCAVLKRLNGVQDVYAQVIYKDDVFEYEIMNGNTVITKHEQKLQNISADKMIGAYCVIIKDGTPRAEIMTMEQIRQAWTHTENGGGVQREYPDQMAKRTVINRGAKMYINSSDDYDLFIEAIGRSTEAEYVETDYTDFSDDNGAEIRMPEQATALPPAEEGTSIIAPAFGKSVSEIVEKVKAKPAEEGHVARAMRKPSF